MTYPMLMSVRLSIAVLVAVIAAGIAVLAEVDAPALPVGSVFLALVVASRLSGFYRYADIAALLLGSGAYAALERSRGGDGAVAWAVASAALVASVAAARLVEWRLGTTARSARRADEVIDQLTIHDPVSTLLKERYGEIALEEEISRARRTGASLTLLLLALDPATEHGVDIRVTADEEARLLGPFIRLNVRSIDRCTRLSSTLFAAILPSTGAGGGATVAHKLCQDGEQHAGRPLRCAVATFPDHAVSGKELLAEAQAGLRLARAADLPVVSPTMLHPTGAAN